jgi:hypothetical protein
MTGHCSLNTQGIASAGILAGSFPFLVRVLQRPPSQAGAFVFSDFSVL